MARGVNADQMTNEFVTRTVKYRGHVYTVTELSMAKYDKTVKQATKVDEDTKLEDFDGAAHTKILMSQCVKEDGQPVDVDDLYARGARLVRQLQRDIFAIHTDDEPEEEIDEDEGEVKAGATTAK